MSALPPEADIRQPIERVCFVPKADLNTPPATGNDAQPSGVWMKLPAYSFQPKLARRAR